jgi:rubrerythrin
MFRRAFTTLQRPFTRSLQLRKYSDEATLEGSQTLENIKSAFVSASVKSRRYAYFAQKADVDGHIDAATAFRQAAEVANSHTLGHLEFLEETGLDPVTGEEMGDTATNLKSAVSGEAHEAQSMYPEWAQAARDEGFDDVAAWFDRLAEAEGRIQKKLSTSLNNLDQ